MSEPVTENTALRKKHGGRKIFSGIRTRLVLAIVLVTLTISLIGLFLNIKHDLAHIRQLAVEKNFARLNALRIDFVKVITGYYSEYEVNLVERISSFPDVVNLVLYNNDREIKFRYDKDLSNPLVLPEYIDINDSSAIVFEKQSILIRRAVYYQGVRYGWSIIRVDSADLSVVYRDYLVSATLLLAGAAFIALVLAILAGNYITSPIRHLAESTRQITRTGKFAVLTHKHETGEIGDLYDGMNAMLAEIQKSAKEIERLNDTRIHNIVNSSLDGIISVNAEGRITFWGRQSEKIFGWTEKDVFGKLFTDILVPERFREQYLQTFQQSLDTDEHYLAVRSIELTGLHRDGRELPVEVSLSAILEKTGWGVNAFVRDLSAKKRTEQELADVQKQLLRNERLAAVGQLTATVAHELRNPLGTIRNTMYLLEQCLDKESVSIESLTERIDRNIQRCDSIVMDLLDFTRDRKINMTHVAICSLLNRMLTVYECPEGVELVCELESDAVALLDEAYFESAFINILDNAVQAAVEQHPGGGRVEIGTVLADGRIGVVISDNGPGIPEEDAEQVFEPLYSTKVYGVGLGLPTVKKIMDKLGGDLALSPAPGGGTRAILWLCTVTVQSEKHVVETI